MRALIAFLISFQIIFSPTVAFAEPLRPTFLKNTIFDIKLYDPKAFAFAGHMVWETNVELRTRARQKAFTLSRATAQGVKGFVGHVGQTMLILWVIHGIAIVKDEVDKAARTGQELNWEEIETMFYETFGHMINNPEIWLSILGATTVGGTTTAVSSAANLSPAIREARQAMSQVLSSSTAKMHFRTLLTSGAMSLVTFVGWEAGMILWQDALLHMGDQAEGEDSDVAKDLEIARDMKFFNLVRSLWTNKHLSEDEARVYGKMKHNIYLILANDDGKRWKWFYNTWRKRITSGDFVLLVTSMTVGAWAGGVAGAKIGATMGISGGLPGMLVMGFFGLAAGVVAGSLVVFVPAWVKEGITEFIRDLRISSAAGALNSNRKRQLEYIRIFAGNTRWLKIRQRLLLQPFEQLLNERKRWRNNYMNAWIERYHNSIIAKQFATFDNSIAAMSTESDFNQKLTEYIMAEDQEEIAGQGLQQFVFENQDAINNLLNEVDFSQAKREYDEYMDELIESEELPTDTQFAQLDLLVANRKRARQVEKNRKTIERANRRIDDSVHAMYNFYSQDARELMDAYVAATWESESGEDRLPEDMDQALRNEIGQLTWMHQNILSILLGFHPEMNDQLEEMERLSPQDLARVAGPARVLLNMFYEYGYFEEEVLQLIESSMQRVSNDEGVAPVQRADEAS